LKNTFAMLEAAAKKAKSNDPVKIARALEGMKLDTPLGPMEMRADNHQLLQPLFVSTLSDKVKNGLEGTNLGFTTDRKFDAKDTAQATTCKMQRPS
jgi:branched-chain amino acid transport system substrate-binding protein